MTVKLGPAVPISEVIKISGAPEVVGVSMRLGDRT
jgi:hypothetical protein